MTHSTIDSERNSNNAFAYQNAHRQYYYRIGITTTVLASMVLWKTIVNR